MSEQNQNSVQESVQTEEQGSAQENQYVPRKAYEEVTSDMHRYKSKVKEAQARLNEYEARLKSIEEEKLKEQNRWKELYEKEQQTREQIEQERKRDRQLYLENVKLSALKAELGGDVRAEYLRFANLDAIVVDENGSLSSESVKEVANQFRQNYPELVPSRNDVNITGAPAANKTNFNQAPKDLSQMSTKEKIEALARLRQN